MVAFVASEIYISRDRDSWNEGVSRRHGPKRPYIFDRVRLRFFPFVNTDPMMQGSWTPAASFWMYANPAHSHLHSTFSLWSWAHQHTLYRYWKYISKSQRQHLLHWTHGTFSVSSIKSYCRPWSLDIYSRLAQSVCKVRPTWHLNISNESQHHSHY